MTGPKRSARPSALGTAYLRLPLALSRSMTKAVHIPVFPSGGGDVRAASQSSFSADTGRIHLADDLDILGRVEIERLQARNLEVMVSAAAATPAVRARFPAVESVTDAGELARLPLMSPADLTRDCPPHSDALLLGGESPGLVLRSSGTSAERKVLYHPWSFTRQVGALGARGARAALSSPPRRVANCMQPGELSGAFVFVQDIGERLCALTFPLGSTLSTEETMELITEHAIDTLVALPSFIADLLGQAEWPAVIRNVLYIGEPMHDSLRRALDDVAPPPTVRSLAYSTSETGPIGYQCPHAPANTHHVHDDAVIVEVVDERTGTPLPDDHTGEIAVTPLIDTGMALFRYRIGDRGRLHARTCPCGSAARLLTFAGRTECSIIVDSAIISNDLLMARLSKLGVDDPSDCQLQVLWHGATYELALLLSQRASRGLTTEDVASVLSEDYTLNRALTSRRCTGLRLVRTERTGFARSPRGKIPVLYERR
jgi:phenylacetate-CoA ligase